MHKLDPKRTVEILGPMLPEVIRGKAAEILSIMQADPKEWITLLIGSPGGQVPVGLYLIDFIRLMKPKLRTVGLGVVSSQAITLYLMGQHRVIGRNVSMLLHEIGMEFPRERLSITKARWYVEDITREQQIYVNMILKATKGKLTRETLLSLMQAETRLRAREIVAYGLAHEIR